MQILIGSAKMMRSMAPERFVAPAQCTRPQFETEASAIAAAMAQYTPGELAAMLRCSPAIAAETWRRYRETAWRGGAATLPAALAYDGMVYQRLGAETMTEADLEYANRHLIIASYLYGLLRPLDLINPYRLEGNVTLAALGHVTLWEYWRPRLTDVLINRAKADDGVLVNLASAEFRRLFDWRRVSRELRVVTPDFKIMADGRPKNVTIYAKMARGAMAREIICRRLGRPADLEALTPEGFTHAGASLYLLPST